MYKTKNHFSMTGGSTVTIIFEFWMPLVTIIVGGSILIKNYKNKVLALKDVFILTFFFHITFFLFCINLSMQMHSCESDIKHIILKCFRYVSTRETIPVYRLRDGRSSHYHRTGSVTTSAFNRNQQ